MKKVLAIILAVAAGFAPVQANYTLHSFSGKVTVKHHGQIFNATQGMALSAADEIDIPQGGKVEIHNAATKELFSSLESGKSSVMGIMLAAKKQASKTAGAINDRMRFYNNSSSGNKELRLYSEGMVKRSMQVYDPQAQAMVVDPAALALHVFKAMTGPGTADEKMPTAVAHYNLAGGGKVFRVENSLTFPIYINVLKAGGDAGRAVEISELGQPMGCYVILPGQAITREHIAGLAPEESHYLVLTNARFDVDELIEQVNGLMDQAALEPDDTLPVYLLRL